MKYNMNEDLRNKHRKLLIANGILFVKLFVFDLFIK